MPKIIFDMKLKLYDIKLFVRKSIKDIISGYDDPLMATTNKFFPGMVKDKKFSLLNGVSLKCVIFCRYFILK